MERIVASSSDLQASPELGVARAQAQIQTLFCGISIQALEEVSDDDVASLWPFPSHDQTLLFHRHLIHLYM